MHIMVVGNPQLYFSHDICMHQWHGSQLLMRMTCCLHGTKPLSYLSADVCTNLLQNICWKSRIIEYTLNCIVCDDTTILSKGKLCCMTGKKSSENAQWESTAIDYRYIAVECNRILNKKKPSNPTLNSRGTSISRPYGPAMGWSLDMMTSSNGTMLVIWGTMALIRTSL